MFELNQYLEELDREGTPISTSLVGAGSLGSGLVAQINKTPGMEIDIVVGIKIKNAIKVLAELSGIDNVTFSLDIIHNYLLNLTLGQLSNHFFTSPPQRELLSNTLTIQDKDSKNG